MSPRIRSHSEEQITLIAAGKAEKDVVLSFSLDTFFRKFLYFAENIGLMDELFEATFSGGSGHVKVLGKCGICRGFMRLIPGR